MQQHTSLLGYKNARFLKLAIVASVAAVVAYALYEPPILNPKQNGGTVLGYTLGTVGALMIVWLMLLGVRKRRYRSGTGSVQGWTSAHVYLGTSLFVIVTLHCAFEFGWNIHTLAYALTVATIVSGFFGVYAYLRYPELITRNLANETVEAMMLGIADLDRKCRQLALDLPDDINAAVAKATGAEARDSIVSASLRSRLTSTPRNDAITVACDKLKESGRNLTGEQAKVNQQLLTEMTRKKDLAECIRRDLRYRMLLELWLYFHVPLAFALLGALLAHVISVFYFW